MDDENKRIGVLQKKIEEAEEEMTVCHKEITKKVKLEKELWALKDKITPYLNEQEKKLFALYFNTAEPVFVALYKHKQLQEQIEEWREQMTKQESKKLHLKIKKDKIKCDICGKNERDEKYSEDGVNICSSKCSQHFSNGVERQMEEWRDEKHNKQAKNERKTKK